MQRCNLKAQLAQSSQLHTLQGLYKNVLTSLMLKSSIIITRVMCYTVSMTVAESKLTSQGQISVPAAIRKKLGLAPGSILEWYENEQGEISVKRASKYTSADIHKAVFDTPPDPKTVEEMDESIKEHFKRTFRR